MSMAIHKLHYEMGIHSPFYDNVQQALCSQIESCREVSGGYICHDKILGEFIVSDADFAKLKEHLERYTDEPAKLIGLAIHRKLYLP